MTSKIKITNKENLNTYNEAKNKSKVKEEV